MNFVYRLLADLVVLVHMTYVLIVVLGIPTIWYGIARRHGWVKNAWLRCGHLAMILIVVTESWAGITCPLTVWEQDLRAWSEGQSYRGAFVANLVQDFLFYDAQPWVFTALYTAFGLLVTASFLFAPPDWKRGPPAPSKA